MGRFLAPLGMTCLLPDEPGRFLALLGMTFCSDGMTYCGGGMTFCSDGMTYCGAGMTVVTHIIPTGLVETI